MPQIDVARQHRNVVLQSAMQYLNEDSTGSTIITDAPASYQLVTPRMWSLLAARPAQDGLSATTGMYVFLARFTSDVDSFTQEPAATERATPSSTVENTRTVFGLNISEAADVFHVSRPTIYQWLRLKDIEQVRSHQDRDRIKALFRATLLWLEQPPLTGRWKQAIMPSGVSVLDLLKAPQIDLDALRKAYSFLSATKQVRRNEESIRAKKAISSLADLFTSMAKGSEASRGNS